MTRRMSRLDEKSQEFFDKHWQQWVKKNPTPKGWRESEEQWAAWEMPCRGWLGRLLFWFTMKL